MQRRLITLLLLMAGGLSPILAQDTKVDKTKVKGVPAANVDTGRQHIQITGGTPPATGGTGARPAMAVEAQLDLFKSEIAELQALAEKQKALVTGLSSQVSVLQQDNTKLWAKTIALELVVKDLQGTAKEYKTHVHNLNNSLGFTQQGNFKVVTTMSVESLQRPTTGPMPGK